MEHSASFSLDQKISGSIPRELEATPFCRLARSTDRVPCYIRKSAMVFRA